MTAGEFVWVFGDCVGFIREIYPDGEAAVSIRELNMSGGYHLSSLTPITSVKHDLGDGWRAGRRVQWGSGEGLLGGTLRHAAISRTDRPTWLVDWDAGPPSPAMQDALELLPDEPATPEPQPADRPDHYAVLRERGHEPWAVMRACMSREGLLGYHVGTAIAYLMRCGLKHATPDDDIRKAAAHLAEARSIIEGREAA